MTHIHKSHGTNRPGRPTAKKADKHEPARESAQSGGDRKPSIDRDQRQDTGAGQASRMRLAEQKRALARHSSNDLKAFDKAFKMNSFSESRRDAARVNDATIMSPPKTYKVVAEDARVRTHPMGLVTANVKQGDRFVVEATRTDKKGNTWAWGYAMGDAKKPGWMPMKADKYQVLKETDEKLPKGYKEAGEPMNQAKLWSLKYVTGKEKMKEGKDYTLRFEVKPGTENAKMYENIDAKGRPTGEMQKLKPGDVVRIRYSLDGKTAVVQRKSKDDDDQHSKWGYVKLDDVRYAPLKDKKG